MSENYEKAVCTDRSDLKRVKALAGGTDILIGVAAAGVVMGTALFFMEPRLKSAGRSASVTMTPWVMPGGAGVALGGSF